MNCNDFALCTTVRDQNNLWLSYFTPTRFASCQGQPETMASTRRHLATNKEKSLRMFTAQQNLNLYWSFYPVDPCSYLKRQYSLNLCVCLFPFLQFVYNTAHLGFNNLGWHWFTIKKRGRIAALEILLSVPPCWWIRRKKPSVEWRSQISSRFVWNWMSCGGLYPNQHSFAFDSVFQG